MENLPNMTQYLILNTKLYITKLVKLQSASYEQTKNQNSLLEIQSQKVF